MTNKTRRKSFILSCLVTGYEPVAFSTTLLYAFNCEV